ncbi:cytochrome protein [Coniochaeta sp. 2T2.1]|nr:cytochrome protein [Coniochaeta sp. 2T2.1]
MEMEMELDNPSADHAEHRLIGFHVGLSAVCLLLFWALWSYLSNPLRKYPGPFLAKWTNLWRLYHISQGNFHVVLERLHRRYGPVVRIGPNVLDLDSPEVIKTVFNTKGDWKKTDYYHASSIMVEGLNVYNLFSQTDPKKHAQEKKPIARYYTLNSILTLEPHMDKVLNQLCHQLETRFINTKARSQICNLGDWILYYTWDVVGAVTFTQPLGYLDRGSDWDGTLRASELAMDYFSAVGCIPLLDKFMAKNPYFKVTLPGFDNIPKLSVERMTARFQGTDYGVHDPTHPDFLDMFVEAKKTNLIDTVSNEQIVAWLMINLMAGADTTAITIRSAIYFCLKHPAVWNRLRAELAAAGIRKSSCPVQYRSCRHVAYLDAVVREALRMLPGVSLPLERYVPPGGFQLADGRFIPEGATVGINPYIIARNASVWGPDADQFRPERWLRDGAETDGAFRLRLQTMNDADLSFGGGSRVCIGKNLGLVQVYKVVATMATLYDIELAEPKKDWTVTNSWFPRQKGLDVHISRRS